MKCMGKLNWYQKEARALDCEPFRAPVIYHDFLAGLDRRRKVCSPRGLLIQDDVQELVRGAPKVVDHNIFRRGVKQNNAVCIAPCLNCLLT